MPWRRAGADFAAGAAGDADPVRLAGLVAAGPAELLPLPVQPASAPIPSSADIVSVIALARVCRCVLMGEWNTTFPATTDPIVT
jgi:hypothetical protein